MRWNCRQLERNGFVAAIPEKNESLSNALIIDLKKLSIWPHSINENNNEVFKQSIIQSNETLENYSNLDNNLKTHTRTRQNTFLKKTSLESIENFSSINPSLLRIQRISGSLKDIKIDSDEILSPHSIGSERLLFAAIFRSIEPLAPLIPQKIAHNLTAIYDHFKDKSDYQKNISHQNCSLKTRQKRWEQMVTNSLLNGNSYFIILYVKKVSPRKLPF